MSRPHELRFTKVCHLGPTAREDDQDQRLAHDQHGNWYLYDWSGTAPDRTDDGPLRIQTPIAGIQVGPNSCSVPVMVTRHGSRSHVGVRPDGLLKLLRIIYDPTHAHCLPGQPTLAFDEKVVTLANLVDYAEET